MRSRTASRLAWALVVAILLAAGAFGVLAGVPSEEIVFFIILPLFVLSMSTVGALVASRQPANAIGWIFLGVAGLWALSSLGTGYAEYVHARAMAVSRLVQAADWIGAWLFVPAIYVPVTFLLLLFPNGRLPSRRWRPAAAVSLAGVIGIAASSALAPGPMEEAIVLRSNPFAMGSEELWRAVENASWALAQVGVLLSVAALIARFRRSAGDERQQMKAIAAGGVVVVVLFVTAAVGWAVGGSDPTVTVVTQAVTMLALLVVPVAAGVAILKYRLYDIDIVIRKTLIYGALAAFITGVYVLIVVMIGALTTDALVPSIVATTIVAAAFQPVRARVSRLADRLVFGKRAAPYEVLARFSDRVGAAYAVDDVMERAARVIAEGTGAERAEVWVRVAGTLQRATSWPRDDGDEPRAGREQIVPVVHQGEDLGEIRIRTSPAHPLRPTEEKLLRDLTAQTGSVLRNLGLTSELEARIQELSRRAEELRASRSRIVQAHDAERRRLERNIHDGAQQHLVALAVKLRLAGSVAAKDPKRAETMLRELHDQTDAALRTLLDLASGIYPAVLEERGIGPALERQAGTVGTVIGIEAEDVGRLPLETEAAVYFVCLEAMQNAAKYARASRIDVRLSRDDGLLTFAVSDDGVGFNTSDSVAGSGLQNMRDRLASFGGEVRIDSTPGRGTIVSGRVPIRQEVAV
jgi:signal transduction histidine kinase